MIPDADIVALSGSVSNHCSRKSAADIVISWTNTACWRSGSWPKRRGRGPAREPPVEREDVEAVPGQVQVTDDLGAQQADDVARDREAEARDDLLRDGRATEH